jgi:transposase
MVLLRERCSEVADKRQQYSEEFKTGTVKIIQEQTKSVADIAQELNIPASTIHNWLSQYRKFEQEILENPDMIRQMEQELKEKERVNQQKEREIADLKEEIAILKKAQHIFSKQRN